MKHKFCIVTALVAGLSFLAAGLAPVPLTAKSPPEVDIQAVSHGNSVTFFADTTRDLLSLSVRVVGPNSYVFEDKVELDDMLDWLPETELADGTYLWEAWVVTADPGATTHRLLPETPAEIAIEHLYVSEQQQTHLTSGMFRIKGAVVEDLHPAQDGNDGDVPRILRVAGAVLELLMPSAQAADQTNDWYRVNNPSGTGSARLILRGSTTDSTNEWRMVNNADGNNRFEIREGGTSGPIRLQIRQGGSVRIPSFRLGSGSASSMDVFPTIPFPSPVLANCNFTRGLTVQTPPPSSPQIIGQAWYNLCVQTLGINQGEFWLQTMQGQTPFRVGNLAQTNSLNIMSGGRIGMGTAAPAAALHVQRANNTARVRIEDTGATGAQTMLWAINNGHPRMRFDDSSQADVRWQVGTSGAQDNDESFIIAKVGSSSAQARLFHNGDLEISGTLSQGSSRTIKEQITEMNADAVLAKLEALPVHEWSYRNMPRSRHAGPMAEDFFAAFNLGHSDKHIAPGDMAGVALAAAKALTHRSTTLEAENAELRIRLERLEAMLISKQ